MARFRKVVEVDALQWTGDNRDEVLAFVGTLRSRTTFTDAEPAKVRISMGWMAMVVPAGDWLVAWDVMCEGAIRHVPAAEFAQEFQPVATDGERSTTDVLRAAADLLDSGTAVTARGALYLAVCGGPEGFQSNEPFDIALYEQARAALVAQLPYPPGQDPERLIRRWSQASSRDDMVRELLAAAASRDAAVAAETKQERA